MLTITHTAADGTLIDGTSKGDPAIAILTANGWRWFPSIRTWGIRGSRDRAPKTHIIDATAAALRTAGFDVELDIDATPRPTAQVEGDRAARQAARVDALAAKAERRSSQAEQAWDAEQRAVDKLPPGGEPIKSGHHSEGRHRRDIAKAHNATRKAIDATDAAKDAQRRAESAAITTRARYNPETVANRIDTLRAEQRADQRLLDGHERTLFVHHGIRHTEKTTAVEGDYRETVLARMSERADQITYWESIRTEQIADGTATNYGPDTITKGDAIAWRGDWFEVKRVNKKTVTIPSIVGGSWTDTMPYTQITGHKSAADIAAQTNPAAAGE
ncbi:DUF3560 domain-containing protein [Rhodococcoides yunnanense]|uniref:DUF3560 domain-containing protein n=1 Tax=Rhodococcoides yunnanense TaxID=278209 RepID=UPI0022B192CF|nr:DUF3560 domain-containing protein [Rhodococcus yunnanensis]MCZ4277437.1 DUF3560 domain-containing protein [Rhodococcus yunnanensis]